MPWVRKRLRGQEVLARCDENGALVAEDGRVEVRYKPSDGRAYRAGARNLEPALDRSILPDDHCAPGEAPPERKDTKSKASKGPVTMASSQAAILAYADGACTGNPGPAGLGALIIDGEKRVELSEFLGEGTNNIAELTAILRVAERLEKEARTIEIRTDSQYAIGLLSKGWKAKANQALVAQCRAALSRVSSVRFSYVAGHAGEPGNERADALAREAVVSRRTQTWRPG